MSTDLDSPEHATCSAALASRYEEIKSLKNTIANIERQAKGATMQMTSHQGSIVALRMVLEDKEKFITQLQADATKMIDEKRELVRLVKKGLGECANWGEMNGAWVLEAQALIERTR